MVYPDDFLKKLKNLGDKEDSIAETVLEAGAAVVLPKVRSNLQSVIGQTKYESRSTGQLVDHLGVSGVKVNSSGNHNIKIGWSEPRTGKSANVTNAMVANILEYGTSKRDQPARPFMKPAMSATRKSAQAAMQDAWSREIGKL